jgi:hypothetical protein
MRLLEREAAVLQEHLAQLHQAQARVRVARKLEAAKLPLSLPPFSPTILSRSDVA